MALRAAADDEQQFTMRDVVDTHRRFMDLSMVYTNDPVWVEHSIHIMELLLAEEKYKVVGFNLEYTRARAGSRPKVAVAQMCVRHHVLVYHYYLATRPCERFARFVNSPHYMFATVDITNDVKALENSGIACQNLSTSRANTRSGAARSMRRTHWFTSPRPSSTPTIET